MTVSFATQFAPEPLASVQHASTTESVSQPEAQPDVGESRRGLIADDHLSFNGHWTEEIAELRAIRAKAEGTVA